MKEKQYEIIGDNMIKVCGWCHKGDSIKTLCPEVGHMQISHGICKEHKQQLLNEINAIRPK